MTIVNKLIVIEGIMGSGKSTLARYLARQLQRNRYPARSVVENTHSHPTNVMRALPHWQKPWLDLTPADLIRMSLQKWERYVQLASQENTFHVFDGQLFHGDFTSLLLMDCESQRLLDYVQQVITITRPLNPFVIYLYQVNVADALQRIGASRGEQWIMYQVNWKTHSPYCERCGFHGREGWVELYQAYRHLTDQAFEQLDVRKLSIETSAGDWQAYRQRILDELTLTALSDTPWQRRLNAIIDSVSDWI
jgi:thymidylate kinase